MTESQPQNSRPEAKGMAGGIPVYCAFDEIVDIAALIPNPRNPNRHGDEQIRLLAKIIQHQGWRVPITVSKRSGFIVRGHGRLMAAKVAHSSECPVDYQDYATEAEEWADLVADNRLSELSEMDNPTLKDILQELDTGSWLAESIRVSTSRTRNECESSRITFGRSPWCQG